MTGSWIIRPIAGTPEVETCARMMAASEPWITLKRDYAASLRNLSSIEKEIHVAERGSEILGFIVLNLHGGFVFGLALLGIYAITRVVEDAVAQRRLGRETPLLLSRRDVEAAETSFMPLDSGSPAG